MIFEILVGRNTPSLSGTFAEIFRPMRQMGYVPRSCSNIGQCPAYSRIRGDTLGTYYDSINNIMDNNNIDLIINFALKTKRLLKKEDKDDTGVT